MAGKPRNRLELRRQHEAAEDLDPMEVDTAVTEDEGDDDVTERKPRKKKAPAKAKARTSKTAKPTRVRIVWHVVSDAFKTVATFDYANRADAEIKMEEMNAKGKGTYFIQKVKEPMEEDAPGLGANVTRAAPPAPKPVEIDLESEADASDTDLDPDVEEDDDEDEIEEDDED